jgi:hypothetical protein
MGVFCLWQWALGAPAEGWSDKNPSVQAREGVEGHRKPHEEESWTLSLRWDLAVALADDASQIAVGTEKEQTAEPCYVTVCVGR